MKNKNIKLSIIFLTSITIFVLLILLYTVKLIKGLPSEEELRNFFPVLSTKVFDRNGELIAELFTEKRTWVEFKDIPENLKLAVLAIEDHTFYQHWGINPKRIFKAMLDNILNRRITVGGSTITQQLAKISFLTQRRNIERKIKELFLALNLEHNFSKNEILEMYLNQVYLGHGAYGVQQAAKIYFSKNLNELTLSEAALLAGLIRSPMYYSPIKNYDRAIKRRNIVLKRMLELGYITQQEYQQAIEEQPIIGYFRIPSTTAPYFVEYIRDVLESSIPPDILYTGGFNIYTTLDLNLQRAAEEIINKQLSSLDKVFKSSEPVQAALLSMDVKTGQILAMVGGRDFRKSQFNRTTQAKRQPGSAFKPIVYLAALEHGFTPTSIIDDTPLIFYNKGTDWELLSTTTDFSKIDYQKLTKLKISNEDELLSNLSQLKEKNKIWIPENYNNKYYGKVTLRKALELSLNSCSIRLVMELGPSTIIEYARKLGITTPLIPTYSLALGAYEVLPIELIKVFNTFANNGISVEPYGIIEIKDKFNNVVKAYTPKESIALSHESAYLITNLLKGVIKNGTGQYAKNLKKTSAGKTGTTNDCTDAWFIGYTPDIICGVWVGFDIKKSLGKDATGGKIACPIWTEFMRIATKDIPDKDFLKPSNVIEVLVDANTGLLASYHSKKVYLETFLKGTEPKMFYIPEEPVIEVPTQEEVDTGF